MFSNKKIMSAFKNSMLALSLCVFAFSFTDKTFAGEIRTLSVPVPPPIEEPAPKERVQVKYQVRFVDENDNDIEPRITKIAFSGDQIVEKASDLKKYELVSSNEQRFTLTQEDGQIVIFRYQAIDLEKLDELKAATNEKIDALHRLSSLQKYSAKEDIKDAKTEKEVLRIYQETVKIHDAIKVQVKYQVLYLDKDGNKIAPTATKIGFAGESITEKAPFIKNYTTPQKQIVTLQENEPNLITFEYTNEPKVQVQYQVKYVDINGEQIAKTDTKLGFSGEVITEKAPFIKKYIRPVEPKTFTLKSEGNDPIVFEYGKTDEVKTIEEFISEKLDLENDLVYTDTNFAGRPDDLKDFVTKSIYKRKLAVTFYATEDDVDKLYWNLWNKSVDASLVRIARFWTARDSAKSDVNTGIPGVNKYSIGITYHITKEQLMESENKIDEIIEKYQMNSMSDLEKAKFIYDYLILNTAINQDNRRGYNRYNHSAILVANAGVCEGYAMAYNRIAERVGLKSQFVGGIYYPEWDPKGQKRHFDTALAQMQTEIFDRKLNHAWNLVRIDGKWYHVDSYHGDYYHTENVRSMIYDSFLRSAQNIGKNRIWNYEFTYDSPEDYPQKFYKLSDLK